jgi:hypothetical protein
LNRASPDSATSCFGEQAEINDFSYGFRRRHNNKMEPTRLTVRAIVSHWRAAHFGRWADIERVSRMML